MLISQRIIKDPKFIRFHQGLNTPEEQKRLASQIRTEVLHGAKFLVHNYHFSSQGTMTIQEVHKELYGVGNSSEVKIAAKEKTYGEFSRLPYDLTVIESDEFLLILRQDVHSTTNRWQLLYVDTKGYVSWSAITSETNAEGVRKAEHGILGTNSSARMEETYRTLLETDVAAAQGFIENLVTAQKVMALLHLIACETLALINCRNVRQHTYKLSRKESDGLSKIIQEKLVYRVLDIYRERDSYVSLKDLGGHLWENRTDRKMRAHWVRGHFKKKNGGLFWWSPFVRCRHNAEDVGVVSKDYRLIDK